MTKGPNAIPVRAQYPKPSGVPFVRVAFAMAQEHALSGGGPVRDPAVIDRFIPRDDTVAREFLIRATQTVGTTTGSGWAAELVPQIFGQYLADLAPYSGAARLMVQALPADAPSPDFPTNYPSRSARSAPGFVEEGKPIPVSNYTTGNVSIGPTKKLATIVPWSRELSKRSDADRIFETMLREDVAAGLDTAFFATTAATSAAPAGLLYGLTAGVGYSGGDRQAIDEDFTALSDAAATGGSGNITFVMAPERLARLRVKAPDLVKVLDIAASAAVPTTRVIAADAAALLVAADALPEIDASNCSTLHLSTAALPIVESGTADPVRSLWQTASTALRVMYGIAFSRRRSTAVAYLDGATW